jgi:hypothetical protein
MITWSRAQGSEHFLNNPSIISITPHAHLLEQCDSTASKTAAGHPGPVDAIHLNQIQNDLFTEYVVNFYF